MTTDHSHCLFCQAEAVPMWGNALRRCTSCGLLFKAPLPTEEELARLYEASWTDHEAHADEVGATDMELARSYAQALAKSLDIADFRGLTILEFGAGTGEMLTALAESGAQVVGVEPFGCEEIRRRGHQVCRSLDELSADIRFGGIVATEAVGAAADGLVQDGINGFIVLERDSGILANAISHLLDEAELRSRMSQGAKEIIGG